MSRARDGQAKVNEMRRPNKSAPRENTSDLVISWALALTAAALPVVYAPVARDPNLAKALALAGALMMITLFLLARARKGETPRLCVNALDVCVVSYLALTCVSWTYSAFRYAAVAAMWPALTYAILYLLARVSLNTESQRLRVVKGLLVGCVAASVAAILEQSGGLPWGLPWYVSGTWFNRTYLVAYLLLLLPLAAWAAMASRGAMRLLGAITLLLGVPALAFTGARISGPALLPMAVAALVGMWPLMAGRRRRQFAIAVAVLIPMGAACVIAGRHQIAQRMWDCEGVRIALVESGLLVGMSRPVLGYGAGAYSIYAPEKIPRVYYAKCLGICTIGAPVVIMNAHNEFTQVFADLGGVGVALFVAIPVAAAWQVRWSRLRKDVPASARTLGVALVTGIIGFLSANLVDPSARAPGMCSFYYLFLALIGSAYLPVATAEDRPESSRWTRAVVGTLLGLAVVMLAVIGWATVTDLRSSVYVVRGETLLTSATDVAGAEAAIEEFRRACAVTPKSVTAQYDLANALAVTGRHSEAMRVYKIVEALSPNYGRLHFNEGTSLYHLRRYSEAEREMALAYRLDNLPDSRARLQCLREFLKTAGLSPRRLP